MTEETPTVGAAPDSLYSRTTLNIVDLISEGPIAGLADSEHPCRSVFFDGVPLESDSGKRNFESGQFEFRVGTLDQAAIGWLDAVSSEVRVGVDVHHGQPWAQIVADPDVDEMAINLGVTDLYRAEKKGDASAKLVFRVEVSTDGRKYVGTTPKAYVIDGKCRSRYEKTIRFRLDGIRAARYWIRLTLDTDYIDSERKQKGVLHVISYVKRRCVRLRYPMSAYAAVSVASDKIHRTPVRTYDIKGLLIKVPSNYDPVKRAYAGIWDGTFKQAWTDNPAWIFYDLVLNKRYGAGNWADDSVVDRYSLYTIAKYCDELIPDGRGGMEPRFTCNCHVTSRTHAFALLQQLASVFRGMAYWSGGTVVSTADMPRDPAHVYAPANVVDGAFRYVGSSLKTRYTVAIVTWHDPDNDYQESVESVEDIPGVQMYGDNKVEVAAFGCTSRGQAQRVGQWFLLTSRLETDTVTFSVGLDGVSAQPGQIIAVCDPVRAQQCSGGRIKSVHGADRFLLDRQVDAGKGDAFTIVQADGSLHRSEVKSVVNAEIETSHPAPVLPVLGALWMLERAGADRLFFRVASVSESEDGTLFTITATQHDPGKFARVDNGAMIDMVQMDTAPVGPVHNLSATPVRTERGWWAIDVSWEPMEGAVEYAVAWHLYDGIARNSMSDRTRNTHVRTQNLNAGNYNVTVIATLWDQRRSEPTLKLVAVPERGTVERAGQ